MFSKLRLGLCEQNCEALTLSYMGKWLKYFPVVQVHYLHFIQNKRLRILAQGFITQDQRLKQIKKYFIFTFGINWDGLIALPCPNN